MRSLKRCGGGSLLVVFGITITIQSQLASLIAQEAKPQEVKPVIQPALIEPGVKTVQVEVGRLEVEQAEQALARTKELYKAGLATATNVQEAEIKAAEARIRQATLQKQSQVILDQAETIVNNRTQLLELIAARYKAGVATATELNTARIELAEARIRLELLILVALRETNLTLETERFKQGIATQGQVQTAQKALVEAQSRLAK